MSKALTVIDADLVQLTENRALLAARAAASPQDQQLQAKLAGLDQVIANFTGDRARLLIQASTAGLASVIDEPGLPVHAESKALPQKLGLAGLLGLVVGILLAAIAEMIRPTLPGSQRVSRRLDVPMLGRLIDPELRAQHEPDFTSLALRVRLAASHADVSTVALVDVDVDGERDLAELARELSMHWPLLRTTIGRRQLLRWRLTVSMGTGTPPVAPDLSGTTLVMDKLAAVHSPVLRVCAMAQMQSCAELAQ